MSTPARLDDFAPDERAFVIGLIEAKRAGGGVGGTKVGTLVDAGPDIGPDGGRDAAPHRGAPARRRSGSEAA